MLLWSCNFIPNIHPQHILVPKKLSMSIANDSQNGLKIAIAYLPVCFSDGDWLMKTAEIW